MKYIIIPIEDLEAVRKQAEEEIFHAHFKEEYFNSDIKVGEVNAYDKVLTHYKKVDLPTDQKLKYEVAKVTQNNTESHLWILGYKQAIKDLISK